ncbi:MAG: diguanylate cyclase [Reinekea sp.]
MSNLRRNKLYQIIHGQDDVPCEQAQVLFAAVMVVFLLANLIFNIFTNHIHIILYLFIQLSVLAVGIGLYILGRFQRRYQFMTVVMFWMIALVWIPSNWLFHGGSVGPVPMLSIVMFSYGLVIRLPRSTSQTLGCIAMMTSPVVMYILEGFVPEDYITYGLESFRILDMGFGYLCILFLALTMNSGLLRRYRSELKRADMLGLELRKLIQRDAMTNVLNHDAILEVAKNRIARQDEVTLFMLDIDNVRRFRDGLGSRSVNLLFYSLGHILQEEALKMGAEVGRLGSGEFLMVLPEGRKDALLADQRIRKLLSFSGLLPCPVTYSGGIVHLGCERSLSEILSQIDDTISAARAKGGNNTVVS